MVEMKYYFQNIITKNRTIIDSFWAVLGSFVLRFLGLVAGIVVARFLGAKSFGEYGILKNMVLSLSVFSTFGLGFNATKYIAQNKSSKVNLKLIIYRCNIIVGVTSLLFSIFCFIFSNYVATVMLREPSLVGYVKIAAFWIFFNSITTLQNAILAGFGNYKMIAKLSSVSGVATFILTVGLTYYFSLKGAFYALLIAQIYNCIINYFAISKISDENKFSDDEHIISLSDEYNIKAMLFSSLPLTLHEIVFSFFSWFCSYLIIYFSNYTELGIYQAASQWYLIIIFIPGVLKNVILSSLSNDPSSSKSIIKSMFVINLLSTVIPAIIIILGSGIIGKIYGKSFDGSRTIIIILCAAAILSGLNNIYIQKFISMGKNWIVLWSRLIMELVFVGAFFLLMHFFKITISIIVAFSMVISASFYLLFLMFINKKICRDLF